MEPSCRTRFLGGTQTNQMNKSITETRIQKSKIKVWQWREIEDRLNEWLNLTDAGLRLRCGELTAQEIRTVRAVLNAIAGSNVADEPRH
jgi:hypothetical protein